MTRRPLLALACWTALTAGCREDPTEIVVYINSDVRDLEAVHLVLRHDGEAPFFDRRFPLHGAPVFRFPGEVTVAAKTPDDARPIRIEVTADSPRDALDYTLVMTARFRARATTWVDVFLPDRCTDPIARVCPLGQVCGIVSCEPAERPPLDAPPTRDADADADASDAVDIVDASEVTDASDAPDVTDVTDVTDAPRRCPDGSLPAAEVCYNGLDENCDGRADEGCASQSCPADGGVPGCGTHAMPATTSPVTIGEAGVNAADPPRRVSLRAFLIDRYEVTVERFRRFWDAGHPAPMAVAYPSGPAPWEGAVAEPLDAAADRTCNWGATGREYHPLNCVDWPTAQAFCAWDGNGLGRLPTEAEWEFAARQHPGVGLSPDRLYPWGMDSPVGGCTRAQWGRCPGEDGGATRRVGSFANTAGFFDLAGNVWEWTGDLFANYTDPTCWGGVMRENPRCATNGTGYPSIRGGSWFSVDAPLLSGASRDDAFRPTTRSPIVGFRCARTRTR